MTSARPTLLYIDDDDALARLVDRGLSRAGMNVVHAPNAGSRRRVIFPNQGPGCSVTLILHALSKERECRQISL